MPPLIEMVGRRFGRLVVLERVDDRGRFPCYRARCDCGNSIEAIGTNLRRGNTKSCGCLRIETATEGHLKHGDARHVSKTAEYRAWRAMISRCENQNVINYADYGGRGVAVCKRWRESFEAFLEDMGRKPSPSHTIDRKDNDAGYSLSNCRWATKSEQALNRRSKKKR